MDFETWDDAAEHAVHTIFQCERAKPQHPIEDLRKDLDWAIDNLYVNKGGQTRMVASWCNIGADAIEYARRHATPLTVVETTRTLIRKQRDYGRENIRRFGRQGLLVRMHDKVARLENLLDTERTPNNESIDDTLLDIVGYSAIGIMWENRTFMLPLK